MSPAGDPPQEESRGVDESGGCVRSWLRHEQQTVRMALVAASHHSAQQNAALRGPMTGARAREVTGGATGHPCGARAAEK